MEVEIDITHEILHLKLENLAVHRRSLDVIMVNKLSALKQCLMIHDEVVFFETNFEQQQRVAQIATGSVVFARMWLGGPRVIVNQVLAFFGRMD